ncbi:MAG TPA: CinA family protein, partial [Bacteroidales bacterium]|nr:CinA family protein [Bacteroidales bacterium]
VSKQVVEAMAVNCKKICNTNYAIATSGIAGPTGGTTEKPVGTVWIAIACPSKIISQQFLFGEHRERTILRTTIAALNMLQKNIE